MKSLQAYVIEEEQTTLLRNKKSTAREIYGNPEYQLDLPDIAPEH